MKPVILVSSCVRDRHNGHNQAARECWMSKTPIPARFFIGDMEPVAVDEVGLPWIPDNYWNLAWKTKASLQWALDQGYTHMFRAFTDTFIDPVRLYNWYREHLGEWDYAGNVMYFEASTKCFCHGGPGYWLSARAAEMVCAVEDMDATEYRQYEDQWVGSLMYKNGVSAFKAPQYSMGQSCGQFEPTPLPGNNVITTHLSNFRGQYDPSFMYQTYFWRYREHAPELDVRR